MRSTYDAGQWLTEPGVKVKVQVVDVSGQNLFDENVSRVWRSCQQVNEVILLVIDRLQSDLWEEIVVYHGEMQNQEGVQLGCLGDGCRTV